MRALRERDDACFETALPVVGASPKDQFYDLVVCHGPHERSYPAVSKSELIDVFALIEAVFMIGDLPIILKHLPITAG